MKVNIYKLDSEANNVLVGNLTLKGGKITPSDKNNILLNNIAEEPIRLKEKEIDPKIDPKEFLENIYLQYKSAYLRASKVI